MGSTTEFFDTESVGSNSQSIFPSYDAAAAVGRGAPFVVLNPGEFIQGIASAATAIYLTISGRVGRLAQ